MSQPRRPSSLSLVHLLLMAGAAEVAIDRIAVEALRPLGQPPGWHSALSYVGLFFHYFTPMLGAGALIAWVVGRLDAAGGVKRASHALRFHAVALVTFAAIAAYATATAPSATTGLYLESAFIIALGVTVATGVMGSSDLGASIGLLLLASPLVVHYYGTVFTHEILTPEATFDSDLPESVLRYGLVGLCVAALASPYCFAPRPVTRNLPRPVPLVVALVVLAAGAALIRQRYGAALFVAHHALGIDLGVGAPGGQMALYLLALATMVWTVVSCAGAPAAPRRQVGVGLGLLVLGGYGFAWPLGFVMDIVGLVTIAEAMPALRQAELGAVRTPPIDDATWQTYATGLAEALRRGGDKVSAVTARGEGDAQSTILVTARRDVAVRVRLERVGGALYCLDVVCGKDAGEAKLPALTVMARGEGWVAPGSHPEPPPAAPPIRAGDDAFDRRFRCRGDGKALYTLLDDGLRARAAASIDGWLAYWPGRCVKWRLFPGVGAPLDHPIPLSDLVLRRAGAASADRLAMVIELVAQIAARGDVERIEPEVEPGDEPSAADAPGEPEPEPAQAPEPAPDHGGGAPDAGDAGGDGGAGPAA